jgi:hypothetical protein
MQINILLNPKSKIFFASFLLSISLIVSSFAQDWRTVHDGMEYAEVTRTIDNQPVRMNLLRLDLKKVRLDVVHAMDAAIGTETVSSMATRHKAIAAINAGFFRLDKSEFAGDPAGILVIDGRLLSESTNDRIALILEPDTKGQLVHFEHLNAHIDAFFLRAIDGDSVRLSGIDRERKDDEAVIFDRKFGLKTKTANGGTEIIFTDCKTKFALEETFTDCKTSEVHENAGNSAIPTKGLILSIGPKVSDENGAFRLLKQLDDGQGKFGRVTFRQKIQVFDRRVLTGKIDVTNGVPQLIKNGKIDITWQEEKTTKSFVETRHPRTAVAKLKDGKFLMITVDGRSESSGGISLYDLAAYLLELGATDAMNLDGGGSTTMFLDGKVVNHPSDKEGERKVSDAIIVTLRKKN